MSIATSPVPRFPRLDCSLLFPDLINFHMQNNPTLPMWIYPNDQDITEITFLEFGRAAHRIAHALRPECNGDKGQVVILIANTDNILHHVVVVGMSIAGLVPFLVSPRNSPAAIVNMMRKVNCSRIITLQHLHQSLIDGIRQEHSGIAFTVEEIPTMSYAFPRLGREVESDPFVPYPHSVSRPDADAPSIYIHSSGSTGFPKPIPQSHKAQIHWMHHLMRAYFHKLSPGDCIGSMALPPFHALGITMQLYLPLAYLVRVAMYPPQTIGDRRTVPIVPTSDNILAIIRRTHCNVVIAVPTFLQQWAASMEAVETLAKLDRVIFGGGPLAEKTGNALWAAGVHLSIAYGGTEFGCPLSARARAEVQEGEWVWLKFAEDVKMRWVDQEDGTYECQILTTDDNQPSIENLTDMKGYATSDLFIKHPTKDLWKIIGRADDVITLASGEKTVPVPMEAIIAASPLLQGAVMFGRGRNQVGVLVEPRPECVIDVLDESAVAAFRDQIWLVIEEANKIAPGFGRIFKEMILIVDPKQPLIRTPKGTVQRKATIMAYEAKINSLYNGMEASYSSPNGSIDPVSWTTEGILTWLAANAGTISDGRSLDPSVDLFAQGFDSLSATYLRNKVVNMLDKSSEARVRGSVSLVSPNIVFENPTLQLLAIRIAGLVCNRAASQNLDAKEQHVIAMNTMIDKYSIGLSGSAEFPVVNGAMNGAAPHPTGSVVLLTGSTGGLGSFLLSRLLKNPRVERVYALNRPSSLALIKERQTWSFVDKGLPTDMLDSDKLVFVDADASQDSCGLSPELYKKIRDSVTVIIHNAWRLDFNLSLVSFEPNVRATRNLVGLALDAKHRSLLRFVFMSTVNTAQSWDRTKGCFPEELQLDPTTAVGMGYGESKYVCERIIAKSGLHATSLRISQIAGGLNGSWATSDWVPIMVKSSIALGVLPNSMGVVSWIRADDVATAVLDVAFSNSAPESQSLNIVNPQRARWEDVMSSIRDAIVEEKSWPRERLTMVPFIEWVVRLEQRAAAPSSEDLNSIPALKLLQFFRSIAHNDDELSQTRDNVFEAGGNVDFRTTEAQRVSNTVTRMKPVSETDARAWIRYWISKGLF